MKKYVLYLLWICFAGSLLANGKTESKTKLDFSTLEALRIKYYSAVENEDFLPELEKFIEKIFTEEDTKSNPIYFAYKGGVSAVKSKHAFWPHKKLSNLSESMDMLESAVLLDKENLEIRFMRFSILHYVPGFLGYSSERNEDIKVIVKLLQEMDYSLINEQVQKGIIEFMIRSERLSDAELSYLNKIIENYSSK